MIYFLEVYICLQKGVLGSVLGQVRVAKERQGITNSHVLKSSHYPTECVDISFSGPLHK